MELSRKQFLESVLALGAITAVPSFARDGRSEFEKCRDDILYFVDNYLVVDDPLYGKLKMTDQQREYLKRISTAPDFFFCAKGRQIGISTANNVFAYWKSIFFGPDHHVFIVEPDMRMSEYAQKMYWGVANSGFMPLPNRVHFIKPSTMMAHHLTNENNTYILDEFDFWGNHSLDGLSKRHLDRFLLNSAYAREFSPEKFEQFKAHMIVSSSVCSFDNTFVMLLRNVDDSRRLVLPSPTMGLKA